MKNLKTALYILLLWLAVACTATHKQKNGTWQAPAAFQVQEVALRDKGKKAYIQVDKTPLTALVFLSPECPLCKNYSLVLNTLQEKFSNEVRFYGIVPGRTYTEADIQQYVNDYKIQFPVWTDVQKTLSMQVQASVTPEVVLLSKSGGLVYRGAIDDWVRALGKKKLKPQQHYLEDAITQYLQNKSVLVKQTSPIGCLINEF